MHEHAPNLLNDDGSASMATMLMMSHHGLRRDLALFARALAQAASWQAGTAEHLKQEWTSYRNVLHGHHHAEDTQLFPNLRGQHPELVEVIDQLTADHRQIDPLMEQGDRAFTQLPDTKPAAALVSQLWHLLGPHLRTEEERIVPQLRGAREFPPPASPDELELFAQGFAWSSHGVAPEVLEKVYGLLPRELTTRLPDARAAFQQRHDRVWGRGVPTGTSHTAVPDWLGGEGFGL
jgi:hemerythrin-like domain-containing protein